MGRYTVHLVGESHYQHVIDGLQPGSPIKLVADPENPNDPRAVKATHGGETIGYIERDSWLIRAMHDDRTPVASRVQEIIGGGPGEMKGVVLDVRTGVDAEEALNGAQSTTAAPAVTAGKKRGCGFWIAIGLAVFVGLIVLGMIIQAVDPEGVERRAAEQEAADREEAQVEAQSAVDNAIQVTSRELAAAYEANEVAAQQSYGGRPLLVTGRVEGITLDFMDNPVVQLPGVNQFLSVQATLNDEKAAAALSQGQEVRLLCQEISEVISAPMLDDCELVE